MEMPAWAPRQFPAPFVSDSLHAALLISTTAHFYSRFCVENWTPGLDRDKARGCNPSTALQPSSRYLLAVHCRQASLLCLSVRPRAKIWGPVNGFWLNFILGVLMNLSAYSKLILVKVGQLILQQTPELLRCVRFLTCLLLKCYFHFYTSIDLNEIKVRRQIILFHLIIILRSVTYAYNLNVYLCPRFYFVGRIYFLLQWT
jgi:hypothetical protein